MRMKRMISSAIYRASHFVAMPVSAKNLYTYLILYADDDGVVDAGMAFRDTQATMIDLKVLIAQGFITILDVEKEKRIVYINDWLIHNTIRPDRKTNSRYQDLLLRVIPDAKVVKPKQRSDRLPKLEYVEKDITDDGYENVQKDATKIVSECVEKLFAKYDMSDVLQIFRQKFDDNLIYKQLQNLILELQKNSTVIKNIKAWLYVACDRDYPLKKVNSGNNHSESSKKKKDKEDNKNSSDERTKRQLEALRKELD